MTCLIKSKNKPLLNYYADILGSESAAYYVLCKNNGFPLEFTPNGEKSDLFQKLLVKNNYSYEDAIEEKSQMYYSSYYDNIGGDWTMESLDGFVIDEKGEPKIDYTIKSIDFSDILEQPIELSETDIMNLSDIQKNLIEQDRKKYIDSFNTIGSESRHNANVKWLADRQKKLASSINKELIDAFGLEKRTDKDGNIIFVSKEKDSSGRHKVIIQFCEYIENGKKGVYDQTKRIEAAANVIQISLLDGDPATINHELAHHYVRMFWNSDVIQNAVQKLDDGDRSYGWQVKLEEKLVDEITKRTTESEGIWNKFSDMIKSAFLWITQPVKQSLLRKASLAFRLNDTAQNIRRDQYILQFIDPTAKRVFNSIPNENIENFDRIRKSSGLKNAIIQFVNDSVTFYKKYTEHKDSILMREYDEYVLYVTNTLSDLTLSDKDFNDIYIYVKDGKESVEKTYRDSPLDPICICYLSLSDLMSEIKEIREYTKGNSSNITTSHASDHISVDLSELMQKILRGLDTRIYEYLHTVPKSVSSANAVQELINKLNIIKDSSKQFVLFISEGLQELAQLKLKLEELERTEYKDLNSQQLYSLWNTIDGFYSPVLNLINEVLGKDFIHDGILSILGSKINNLQLLTDAIRSHLISANKVISLKETHKYLLGDKDLEVQGVLDDLLTEEQKERFIDNFDDQLIVGKLFEDINMLQPHIGLSSRSKSLIIRVARNMILSANSEIRKASLKDAARITKLYFAALPELRKLGLKEIQSVFQEKDENGHTTGYFTRDINYGRFYRDLDNYKKDIVEKANERLKEAFGEDAPQIVYDTYKNTVFPPDDDPKVKDIIEEYSNELDDWLCKHSNRMFIPEYYKIRRNIISANTRNIMQDIQSRINALRSKAPMVKIDVDGVETKIQATWELSAEDQQSLVNLQTEYEQLSNFYYSDGTKKTGEQLKIAEEINEFNKWKNKKIDYNQNDLKFRSVISEIRKKYGNNSIQESRFIKLNTSIVVNPKYYDFVISKLGLETSDKLEELRKRRNDLKNLIYEFDKKGINVEQKRRQEEYWESLKEIDAEIKKKLEPKNNKKEDNWYTYFTLEPVMYDDTETLLDHMLKQDIRDYRKSHPADNRSDDELRKELIRKYQYTYTWYDTHGESHESVQLVSVFNRWVPVGASINERKFDGKFGRNVLITKYSQQFSDVSESSILYNPNYNKQDSHSIQPNRSEYDNSKQWELIKNNQNIKKLYDALIYYMNDSSSKLPTNSDFNYKLPQITGRRLTILRRSGSLKEICDACKYNFSTDWKLNERDDADINYEDNDLKLRANGTRINTVPTRYIRQLDHPEYITSDVIGSVIAFIEAANNFVVKTQLSSELEIIKQQLKDREDSGVAESNSKQATTNTIKQLTNMMDDQLYANNTKFGDKNANFTRKQELIIKFFTKFQHFGRILMLGYNLTSMSVGYFESFIRSNLEAFLGKDYNLRDLMHAYNNSLKYSLSMFMQAGSIKSKIKHVELMKRFGISKRLTESYHSTERNRFIKVLSENINGMFGFTLGDYSNSSFQLSMALSNVRFIDDPDVKKGFYTKHTLIVAIKKANPGMSHKDAKTKATILYKESGICLEDAYELNNGELYVKEEYKNYVTDIIENRVTGKCYQRLAEALGVVPQNDNPGYGLQILLRPIGVLRNYLFTVIARNWNWAHDLQRRYIDNKGNVAVEDDMIDGYLDIDSGNMNIGLHQGIIGWMKMVLQDLPIINKKINSVDFTEETREFYNYAAKKVCLEILTITTLVGISTLFKALQKGAKDDDWWIRFGYLTSVRLVNSFISVLDPTSFLEVIKNISTLISPLNDLLNTVTLLSDMVGLSGHSPFDEIQSGSYKGRTRLFKNIMRLVPFGNAYEDLNTSALKSRANWYIQQDPLTWGSIGGAFDQLWDAGK